MSKLESIKQIAEISGYSTATVSRVINSRGGYSKETEKKILKIIEENDFIINQNAKYLRTKKTKSIGVIVPDITNEIFSKLVRYIGLFFLEKGYFTLICDSNESLDIERKYINELQMKNIEGIIYIQGQNKKGLEEMNLKIPIVYIDRRPDGAEIIVESDNYNGGEIAALEIIKRGCKNILMLRDIHDFSTINDRELGFRNTLKNYEIFPEIIYLDEPSMECASKKIKKLIENGFNFDGVFASNDLIAIGIYKEVIKYNKYKKITIIGFDGNSLIQNCYNSILTIEQNIFQMANKSCEILYGILTDGRVLSKKIKIPVRFCDYSGGK